jgi:hypothetical protein
MDKTEELFIKLQIAKNILVDNNILGQKIYTYDLFNGDAYLYADKILYVGEKCVYDDNEQLKDEARKHNYEDYGEKWFLDKQACIDHIEEVEDIDEIVDNTIYASEDNNANM